MEPVIETKSSLLHNATSNADTVQLALHVMNARYTVIHNAHEPCLYDQFYWLQACDCETQVRNTQISTAVYMLNVFQDDRLMIGCYFCLKTTNLNKFKGHVCSY